MAHMKVTVEFLVESSADPEEIKSAVIDLLEFGTVRDAFQTAEMFVYDGYGNVAVSPDDN